MAGPSYRARALLALTLTVLFYALALGGAAGLGYLAWDLCTGPKKTRSVRLGIVAGIAAVTILYAVFPRRERFRPPGPRLARNKQGRLFGLLDDVAHRVGEPRPEEVYLIADVNAFVANVGGFLGFGQRRILALGLPLLDGLSVAELRSVVAHEYGHFTGGDTKLGGLIYSTRSAVMRTVTTLDKVGNGAFLIYVLRLPFLGYAKLFLRITQAMSRRQEYAADELAAKVAGSAAAASALARLDDLGESWNAFLFGELVPLLERDVLPPVLEGYRTLRAGHAAKPAKPRPPPEPNPYDTHPPIPQRIAALRTLARPAPVSGEEGPASALLEDVPGTEFALLAAMLPPGIAKGFTSMPWSETGEAAFLSAWRASTRYVAEAAPGLAAKDLPFTERQAVELGRRLGPPEEIDAQTARFRATYALGAALGLALRARGGRIVNEPGQPVRVEHAGGRLDPIALVAERIDGALMGPVWDQRLADLGLADAVVGDAALAGPAPARSDPRRS
jgi:Zn-dependent protease with chaperone function